MVHTFLSHYPVPGRYRAVTVTLLLAAQLPIVAYAGVPDPNWSPWASTPSTRPYLLGSSGPSNDLPASNGPWASMLPKCFMNVPSDTVPTGRAFLAHDRSRSDRGYTQHQQGNDVVAKQRTQQTPTDWLDERNCLDSSTQQSLELDAALPTDREGPISSLFSDPEPEPRHSYDRSYESPSASVESEVEQIRCSFYKQRWGEQTTVGRWGPPHRCLFAYDGVERRLVVQNLNG